MFFVAWIWSLHQHGCNRKRGLVIISFLLPLLSIALATGNWCLSADINETSLRFLNIMSDGHLYEGALFEIWQLWTFVFYFDSPWHFCINALFFLPVCFYWERHFNVWFLLVLIILLPVSVALCMLVGVPSIDLGSSPLVYGLLGGLLINDRQVRAEIMRLQWWGTRISLRRSSLPLHWVVLTFLSIDLIRFACALAEPIAIIVYLGNALVAMSAGASVYSVLGQLRLRMERSQHQAKA